MCGWLLGQSGPTHPPLVVLLPVHDDHVPLGERQLVRVVGHAVVEGFDPLGLQLGLWQEAAAELSAGSCGGGGGPWGGELARRGGSGAGGFQEEAAVGRGWEQGGPAPGVHMGLSWGRGEPRAAAASFPGPGPGTGRKPLPPRPGEEAEGRGLSTYCL